MAENQWVNGVISPYLLGFVDSIYNDRRGAPCTIYMIGFGKCISSLSNFVSCWVSTLNFGWLALEKLENLTKETDRFKSSFFFNGVCQFRGFSMLVVTDGFL